MDLMKVEMMAAPMDSLKAVNWVAYLVAKRAQ